MTDPRMIERVGHADMYTQVTDMRARADTAGSGARSRAHRADLRTRANLRGCRAAEENRDRNQGSSKPFHFPFLRDWELRLSSQ